MRIHDYWKTRYVLQTRTLPISRALIVLLLVTLLVAGLDTAIVALSKSRANDIVAYALPAAKVIADSYTRHTGFATPSQLKVSHSTALTPSPESTTEEIYSEDSLIASIAPSPTLAQAPTGTFTPLTSYKNGKSIDQPSTETTIITNTATADKKGFTEWSSPVENPDSPGTVVTMDQAKMVVSNFTMASQENVYYVALDGNDSNPGSEDRPWRTIQKAADTLVAGDTVYIKEGTYEERVFARNSGKPGNYITYAAYPGDTVTIDGQNVTMPNWSGLFHIKKRNHIRVTGLQLINAQTLHNSMGILVMESDDVIVESCYTYNTRCSGIGVWQCSNIVVAGNEIEEAGSDIQEGITIGLTNSFEVTDNYVHHVSCEGISAKQGSYNGTIYNNYIHDTLRVGLVIGAWDNYTHDIDVYNNEVHSSGMGGIWGSCEMGGTLENIRFYNNIAYDNVYDGISLASYTEPGIEERPM